MNDVEQAPAGESAPIPALPSTPLESMTRAERDAWRADDSTYAYRAPTPADPAPAQPADQAVSTDASPSPASEPGKTKTEHRFQELLAERAAERARADAAERRLAELSRTPAPKPDVSRDSSPEAPKFQTFDAWSQANPGKDFEDYIEARATHVYESRKAAETQAAEHTERTKTIETTVQKFQERLGPDIETFTTSLPPMLGNLVPTWLLPPGDPVRPHNVVANEILNTENPRQILEHFRDHPDAFVKVLNAGDVAKVVKAFGRLEASLESAAVSSTVAPPAPPKVTTSAPPPPRLVNQRPAEAADPVMSAVNSGDYRAFKAAEDAKERARR